jgi:hypothetical protein
VWVVVEGAALNALVNTAAQVSLANKSLLAEKLPSLNTKSTCLKGFGPEPVPAIVCPDVEIRIGDLIDLTPMYFSNLDVDMLLRLGFLEKQ